MEGRGRVGTGEEAAGRRGGGAGGAEGRVDRECVGLGCKRHGGGCTEGGWGLGLERREDFADVPRGGAGDLAAQRVVDALGVADLGGGARHGDEDLQDCVDERPADFTAVGRRDFLFPFKRSFALEAEVLAHEGALHDFSVAGVGGGREGAQEGGAAVDFALLVGAEEAGKGAGFVGRGEVRDFGDEGERVRERGIAVAAVEGGDALQAVDAASGGAVRGHGGGEGGVDEVFVETAEVEVHGAERRVRESAALAVYAGRGPVASFLDVEGGQE